MPTTPSPAQSEASRLNGAHSTGPAALGTLLRHRGRIERVHRAAMADLDALRQRLLARP